MKQKILIVDDERSLLEFLKGKLSEQGYTIHTAHNGSEFYRRALQSKPDLIILDLLLPDGAGTEHYGRLLNAGFDRNTPVIFISTLARNEDPRYSPPKGRFALFGKPFDFQSLMREVDKLLASCGSG